MAGDSQKPPQATRRKRKPDDSLSDGSERRGVWSGEPGAQACRGPPPRPGAGRGAQGGQRRVREGKQGCPRCCQGGGQGLPRPAWCGEEGPQEELFPEGTGQPDPRLPVRAGEGPEPRRGAAERGPPRLLSFELITAPAARPGASPAEPQFPHVPNKTKMWPRPGLAGTGRGRSHRAPPRGDLKPVT